MRDPVAYGGVPAPRAWLGVAFVGVWIYLISQLMRLYPGEVAAAFQATPESVVRFLAVTSGIGSLLVLAGLVAAFWRANLAAGLSSAGVRGLVLGAAGIGVLLLFEMARVFDLLRFALDPVGALLAAQSIGDVMGNALAFAGLASLAVGLSHAVGLFGRPAEAPPPSQASADEAG